MPGMGKRPTKRRGPLLWLAARSRRFWLIASIVLPVLYVASFGPVCWLYHHIRAPEWAWTPLLWAYAPLSWIAWNGPAALREPLTWYVDLWAPPHFGDERYDLF